MANSLRKLIDLSDGAGVLIAVFDGFDRLQYANTAFRQTFHLAPAEDPFWADIMRRNYQAGRGTVIRAEDFDAWLVSTQSRRGKTGFRSYETDLHDGRWLLMTETVQPHGWMLCIASDITALRADERAIRQDRDFAMKSAHTDELTGIANRRFVTDRLEAALKGGDGGCLCMLDIDHFKTINDRYGHPGGDTVLRDFARKIQDDTRRGDSFGRVGGEEFMLVLPQTGVDQAELIVERMLVRIRKARPFGDGGGFSYTFSAGIAEFRAGETVSDVYERADRALYAAKIGGRDRIAVDDRWPREVRAGG